MCISEMILDELRGVLRRPKFGYTEEQIRLILSNILDVADIVETSGEVDLIKEDPDDNSILDCAMASIEIVSPRQFLDAQKGPRR